VSSLPIDLWSTVARCLSPTSLATLMCVSRELHKACREDTLWRVHFLALESTESRSRADVDSALVIPDKHRVGRVLPASRCSSVYSLYRRRKLGMLEIWVVSSCSGTPFLVPLPARGGDDPSVVADAVRSAQLRHDGFAPHAYDLVPAAAPAEPCLGVRNGEVVGTSAPWVELEVRLASTLWMSRRHREQSRRPTRHQPSHRFRDRHVYHQVPVSSLSAAGAEVPVSVSWFVASIAADTPPVPSHTVGPRTVQAVKEQWLRCLVHGQRSGRALCRPCACSLESISSVLSTTAALLGKAVCDAAPRCSLLSPPFPTSTQQDTSRFPVSSSFR
jgi:hypothetical protein